MFNSKNHEVTPLKPTCLLEYLPVLLDVPPVIVSPSENVPCTFDTITTPCETVPPELYALEPEVSIEVVPSVSNNSKVVDVKVSKSYERH